MNNQQICNMISSQIMNSGNPLAKNALAMYQRNDITGLQNMAQNMCKQKGIDPQSILNNFFGSAQTK